MNGFDLVSFLTSIGLGHYATAVIALIAAGGYGITWIAPLMPAPTLSTSRLYDFVYGIVNKIAGNVGHATNVNAPSTVTTVSIPVVKMIMFPFALAACAVGLSACVSGASMTPVAVPSVTAAPPYSQAEADALQAIKLYGIAKGIAGIAVMAQPALGPAVTLAEAIADPIVAQVQTAISDANMDAASLENLVQTITAQANSITVTSAAVIKVVPSATN